jgi:hypothetical protein
MAASNHVRRGAIGFVLGLVLLVLDFTLWSQTSTPMA